MENKIKQSGNRQNELVHILHEVQERFGYIPPERLAEIAKKLNISESEIYGVLTFYKAFSLEPGGEHTVTVCMGTACHVRGGQQITDEMERKLDIKVGQTSADGKFTLETVNCLGCCAIGPVVTVDGKYYSHATMKNIASILKEY
jgi:NADH:ubiquinone oxidoreductase subunit E